MHISQFKLVFRFLLSALTLLMSSCETRKVKYSGLNDLTIGVQQIILYENGEFYLELGAGGKVGAYEIVNDTINLEYSEDGGNWPDQILMTKEYFRSIANKNHHRPFQIQRNNLRDE